MFKNRFLRNTPKYMILADCSFSGRKRSVIIAKDIYPIDKARKQANDFIVMGEDNVNIIEYKDLK